MEEGVKPTPMEQGFAGKCEIICSGGVTSGLHPQTWGPDVALKASLSGPSILF